MATVAEERATRVYVILNPAAGFDVVDTVREALARYFAAGESTCEVHETCPSASNAHRFVIA